MRIQCVKLLSNHALCLGWAPSAGEMVSWPNPLYIEPKATTKASAAGKVAEMASRVAPPTTVLSEGNAGGWDG